MEFKLTHPCGDCPFRTDKFFYLPKGRKSEIASDLLFGDKTFICHNTTGEYEWSDEGEETIYTPSGEEQHCAGALIVMAKEMTILNNFMLRLAIQSLLFNPTRLDINAPVYESMEQFVNATDENGYT